MTPFITQTGEELTNKFSDEDLTTFLTHLRPEDQVELDRSLSGLSPLDTLRQVKDLWMVKDVEGNPAVVMGLFPLSNGSAGILFLTSSYLKDRMGRVFLKHGKKIHREWLDQYPLIVSWCYRRASHHFKFIKMFGFEKILDDGQWLLLKRTRKD